MVECWLPYGRTEVHVAVPIRNLLGIAEIEAKAAEDPEAEILGSIQNPIGSARLAEISGKGKKAAVALDGDLPSTHMGFIAEQVVGELSEGGVEDISVIISPGTVGSVRADLWEQLKPLERFKVRIARHSWTQVEVVRVGKTSGGTRVSLNREFVEADIRVVIGEVKPDPVTGYSGGSAILFPGLSRERDIWSSLRRSFDVERFSRLKENPVYEDSVEAAELLGVDFSVNIVSDPRGRPMRVFSGELGRSWRMAVELAEETYTVSLGKQADLIVVSAGGYPYDRTLYRATMTLENLLHLGRRESKVILLAECLEGLGDPYFHRYMAERRDLKEVRRELRRRYNLGGERAYRLRRVLEDHQLVLVSILPDNTLRSLGIRGRRTATDALGYITRGSLEDEKVVVVPFGSVTVPAGA